MCVRVAKIPCPNIVAIGASAGGLAAFQELIENLPIDTRMVFVLLSHILPPDKFMEILGSTLLLIERPDGAEGLKNLKEQGGMTIAQRPDSSPRLMGAGPLRQNLI